ncbi:MAG TPA: trehalose-phosphatase [Bryobacteraceae bacterium]|nr:trehalose-phosphatase [Bryobacteraceae bacterium]
MTAPVQTAPIEVWLDAEAIRQRILQAQCVFLFMDFDGTLAPIVSVPSLAALPQDLKTALRTLIGRRDVVPAIISGREVIDLQNRVALPLIYAGNHGLEIRGAGLEHTVHEAQQMRVQLLAACNVLRARLEPYAGTLVECKRLTASVHVRQADRAVVPAVMEIVQSVIGSYRNFRVSGGKEVFEIRPKVVWNKGSAVRWILEQMEGREVDAICIGDDATDEDMFAELKDGITVRVGSESATAAQYCIRENEVLRFLHFVGDTVEQRRCARQSAYESSNCGTR